MSLYRAITLTLALVLPAVASAQSTDWPEFRFDDKHSGVNSSEHTINGKNAPTLRLSWQAQLGELVDYSSPVVVSGVVYIGSTDGTLWAYPADGCGQSLCDTPLWQSTNLAQIMDSPTVANGVVYIGSQTDQNNNDGLLSAFSASGCGRTVCAPLWQGQTGDQSILESSPAVADGVVYVGGFDGKLYAFNADGCGKAKCKPLWTAQTGASIESTPTVYKGRVYIGSDDGKLYVFKAAGCGKKSCKAEWIGEIGSAVFQSTPAIVKGVVYITGQHALMAFDAKGCGTKSCKPLWQASDENEFFNGSPTVHGGYVYIPWATGLAAYAADGCGGQGTCPRLWTLEGDGFQAAVVSAPTIANGVIYAGRNTAEVLAWREGPCGNAVCHNIWSGATNDEIVSSSPTLVNGKLYVGSNDKSFPENISGRIYVWEIPH